jgi:hypothetical protein
MDERPWIVPGYLMRGSVTIVGGPGSAGKSSLMIGWCTALALGAKYHRFKPPTPSKVIFYNVEDDLTEQRRRLSAALRQFDRTPYDIAPHVLRLHPTGIGTLLSYDRDADTWQPTQVMQALEAEICHYAPDVTILDPLVELHTADENDNTAMRAVIARFRALAEKFGMAVVILHHTVKHSTGAPGDQDILRGASSSVAAARVALTVLPMSKEEAENLQIADDVRRGFFRVDGAKSNYAPAHAAEWFQLTEYRLDNGDDVAAAVPWTPPADRALDVSEHDTLCEELAAGIDGQPYSPRLTDSEPRSVLHLFRRHGIKTADGQKKTLYQLLANGFDHMTFNDRQNRRRSKGLRFKDGRPRVQWVEDNQC